MSEHNITVQGGSSVRLPTAGKFCDRDIVVTAKGGGGAAVETCTIRIVCNTNSIYGYTYLAYRDGDYVPVSVFSGGGKDALDVTLSDVICNGYIYVQTGLLQDMAEIAVDGEATAEFTRVTTADNYAVLIYAPSVAGSESTVTLIDYD